MDGNISIRSQVGEGSVFCVELPFEKQTETCIDTPETAEHLENLHILVVDDNETNRILLRDLFVGWGARCQAVSSGSEAIHALGSLEAFDPIHLAVLDVNMPGMDGPQTVAVLKADPRFAGLPIILLGSSSERMTTDVLEARGFAAFLTKPVRKHQLFAAISGVIEGKSSMSPMESVRAATSLQRVDLNGLRVLVAEDNTVNQRLAARILEKWGCKVLTVANGLEAVHEVERIAHDVVLMDCQMPEMDGHDASREIRRREVGTNRRLPIVAMTANAMKGDREKCLEAGMDDYVSKPIQLDELAGVLLRIVRPRASLLC